MIARLTGKIVEKIKTSLIIDVNGVGYEVQVATDDFEHLELDSIVTMYTYHHVREQSEDLFGFTSLTGKRLFELLITVQGVGPKVALAILSLADMETVRNAIAKSDVLFVSKATGVGRRTAERVIVDLSDKVGQATDSQGVQSYVVADKEALEALMALGFNLADASKALEGIDHSLAIEERIKLALRNR